MLASSEKNIIGTVSHASGRRADIELINNQIQYSIYGKAGNLINTGTARTPTIAGVQVAMIMQSPE